ncbi:MAG: hypothetical protein K8W52_30235 [Deltaproteobacteria bacterium]|nr:hypothetical protein [Deltaproteobacteria bacterium]
MLQRLFLFACVAAMVGCASAKTNATSDGAPGADGDTTADAPPNTPDGSPDALVCAKTPCSMVPQCGCGANMACDLDTSMLATGATACRNAGIGTEETTCVAAATCTAGYGCIGGHCRKWCTDDTTCTGGSGAICVIQVVFGNPPMNVPGATTCSTDCDPTSATPVGCPATWGCNVYYSNPDGVVGNADDKNFTDCDAVKAGAGGAGATCTTNGDCQATMDCISFTNGTMSCHPTCLCPSGNCAAGTCPSGTGSCHAFTPSAQIGTREYGTCF